MWPLLIGIVGGLLLAWLALLAILAISRPEPHRLREAARILADVVRLVSRLARDRSLHRGVRLRLWLLLAYLASPIDLVPDFIPVIGFADDAIIVSLVLRSVIKRAGADAVRQHWPGSIDGL